MLPTPLPGRRLVSVPLTDALLLDTNGEPLHLRLPSHDPGATTHADRRASAQDLVFAHELYPIQPAIKLAADIPLDLWSAGSHHEWLPFWHRAWGSVYAPLSTTAKDYHATILRGEEWSDDPTGLFGVTRNPLKAVLDVATKYHERSLLEHFVLAVALQYYLFARSLFLEVRTDAGFAFEESYVPYAYLLFPHNDWKQWEKPASDGVIQRHWLPRLELEKGLRRTNLHDFVQVMSYPYFVYKILEQLFDTFEAVRTLYENKLANVEHFCEEKLKKNFAQSLTCMRFKEVMPSDLVERLPLSLGASMYDVKFYPHPKAIQMRALVRSGSAAKWAERVPHVFAHLFFSPTEPVLLHNQPLELQLRFEGDDSPEKVAMRAEQHLLWRLLLYHPLSEFQKGVKVKVNKEWRGAHTLFPTTPEHKYRVYDGYIPLTCVRARYTFYVREEKAYAYVPALLAGMRVPVRDEMDVREMSQHAWQWCVHAGRIWKAAELVEACRSLVLQPVEQTVFGHVHDALQRRVLPTVWWMYWVVWRVSGKEEDAVASIQAAVMGATRAVLRASYEQVLKARQSVRRSLDELILLYDEWDRCSRVEHEAQEIFPASVIPFGNRPWIEHFLPHQPLPQTLRVLQRFEADVRRKQALIVQELASVGCVEDDHTRRLLLAMYDLPVLPPAVRQGLEKALYGWRMEE